MPDLSELIARVEGLEGADYDLFHDVARAVCPELFSGAPGDTGRFMALLGANAWESAALALVTRVLPGWGGEVQWAANGHGYAAIAPKPWVPHRGQEAEDVGGVEASAPTLPLALILALLRALAVKEKDRGE